MKIYTSYLGNVKKVIEAGIFPIQIVRYPKPYHDYITNLERLAPLPKMFNMDEETFKIAYLKLIEKNVDAKKLIAYLEVLSNGEDVALLCFESLKNGEWCHRTMLAEWLNEKLNLGITEFGETESQTQTNLFGGENGQEI